ncbi:hypothetical protein [Aquimarina sediminis]|nr:hypothetical protein [Aquimarina sediminis]
MTEKKLYDQLMKHKSKHGITRETQQYYLWALQTISENNTNKESQPVSQV